jgi:hypothetical protein
MSTSNPNASVNQAVCCAGGCGGANCVGNTLNSIGKWGTLLTSTITGKPTTTTSSGRIVKPAAAAGMSQTTLIVIVLVVGAILFVLMRK